MTCPRHTDAGAYLLGALPPAEHAEFQAHLPDCGDCRSAVGELADLPGLLARVPEPALLAAGQPAPEPPPAILAGLLAQVRRRRTNRMVLATVAAVVTVLALVGAAVLAFDGSDGADPGPPVVVADGPTRTIPMQLTPAGAGYDLQAKLDVTPKPWGTDVRVHCTYAGDYAAPEYILYGVAAMTDHELARWTAPSGQTVDLSASTDVRAFDRFEIRSSYGKTVMRGGP